MARQKNNIIAVLDIGNSRVVCFIARFNNNGNFEILGIGHNVSAGVKAGIITDIAKAEKSIIQAIEAAKKMAGESITKVYVSISSNNLISSRVSSKLKVTGHEIRNKDVDSLLFQALERYNEQQVEVIHTFPCDYILDGNRGITNPLGMYADYLACDLHVVSVPSSMALNTASCVAGCGLEVEGFISSSYASGLACLTEDEMKLGVTLIEMGASSTSISVFNDGQMQYTDGIALGGINVTNDIARALSTDFTNAERIKSLYGTLIPTSAENNEVIEVPISNDEDAEVNTISKSMLSEVIRARVEEILELAKEKLESTEAAGMGGNKVVITGGGSQMNGVKELTAHMFSKKVRLGHPKAVDGLADSMSGVAFSTPVGMLFYVHSTSYGKDFGLVSGKGGMVSGVLKWIKSNFF